MNKDYESYLNSNQWKLIRTQVLERDGYRCRLCNRSKRIQVHHRIYPEVYGEEPLEDLITLCGKCHDLFHGNVHISVQYHHKQVRKKNRPRERWGGREIDEEDELEELNNQCGGCFGHDYQPTFNGGDTYYCTICHKEIDMTED